MLILFAGNGNDKTIFHLPTSCQVTRPLHPVPWSPSGKLEVCWKTTTITFCSWEPCKGIVPLWMDTSFKFVEADAFIIFLKFKMFRSIFFFCWTETAPNLPYFVNRTRNGMLPLYLNFEEVRDMRKITTLRHIEGDIWVCLDFIFFF